MPIQSYFNTRSSYVFTFLIVVTFVAITYLFILLSSVKSHPNITFYFDDTFFEQQLLNNTSFEQQLFNETSFKKQLFNERLSSYNIIYDDSLPACDQLTMNAYQRGRLNKISDSLQIFRKQIPPYPKDYFQSRGIVLTAGSKQMKFARANLKMMALTRTKLSIQIWYSSDQISHNEMINLLRVAPNLNASVCCFHTAECRNLKTVWKLNTNYLYKPRRVHLTKPFPYKPAAIISSTFSEVLFLDCDAYVTRDPEELFLSDPMYLKFGALFFPDGYKSRQNPAVWKLFNTVCTQDEYELDSAMILVDKRRVWDGLYMTKLMNDDYQLFYGHVTDGDKDTFRFAFRYMQVKYYLVMVPCSTGSFDGTYFCGFSLCKTDSLAQHIYVNHIHKFKYEGVKYIPENLGYTRIGIGDPNNHAFYFHHCRPARLPISCFHILKEPSKKKIRSGCHNGNVPLEEIEDHQYMWNESLLSDQSKDNRILMTKTNNVIPNFVENFLRIEKEGPL